MRSSFSAAQDLLPFVVSGAIVLLMTMCAVVANKLHLGARALQALAAFVAVCAAVPVLVHWGARGESGGGLQIMLPLRMIVFVLVMNMDWLPGTVGLVVAALVAALAVALSCACVDQSMLVTAACITCAAVLAERWCWCVSLCPVCVSPVLFVCMSQKGRGRPFVKKSFRIFRMRSLWFENLVVEAMAKEAGCLLKASMSGDCGASK